MPVITEDLSLAHHNELYERLRSQKSRISEFSFANLYLFRKTHLYKYVNHDGCIRLAGQTHDKKSFFLPLSESCDPDFEFLKSLIREHGIIYPVPEEWLECFNDEEFLITHDENDSDYIYTVEKLASYPGRKLHKKRNLLKQFHEAYTGTVEKLTPSNIDAAKQVLDAWAKEAKHEGKTDIEEILEAFNLMSELKLDGQLYFADGKASGFIIGEQLRDDTHVLHFAKGLTEYKGIYQFMFNEYAKSLIGTCSFMNLEQDLGIESLRQAKGSYLPDVMEKKYRISLRD